MTWLKINSALASGFLTLNQLLAASGAFLGGPDWLGWFHVVGAFCWAGLAIASIRFKPT